MKRVSRPDADTSQLLFSSLSEEQIFRLSTKASLLYFETMKSNNLPVTLKTVQSALEKSWCDSGFVLKKKWWKWSKEKPQPQHIFKTLLCKSIIYANYPLSPNISDDSFFRIPILVHECVSNIKLHGLKAHGIFRVNGSEKRMAKLNQIFDNNPFGKNISFEGYNIYDCADLLKKYIRSLPEPLLTTELYPFFLQCMGNILLIQDISSDARRIALVCLLKMLPPPHLVMMEYLIELLALIVENVEENQMTANNLARIFAPNLLRPRDDTQALKDFQTCSSVIEFMIINHGEFCITREAPKPVQRVEEGRQALRDSWSHSVNSSLN